MIISHEHKFIFIKCRKVAGSSIELSLAEQCGPDDVITTDPCKEPVARNFDQPYSIVSQLLETPHPINAVRAIRDWRKRPAFYSHIDARSARSRLGKKIWDSYYKFCFERNPWDKCVSWYYWFYRRQFKYRKDEQAPSFREHMLKNRFFIDKNFPVDWRRYTIGDELAVDFVGQYSNINADFERITSDLGLDCSLGHNDKSDFRDQKSRDLSTIYDDETREAVERLFRKEIKQFGYEFPV